MDRPSRSDLAVHWGLDPETVFLNHGSFGATPWQFVKNSVAGRTGWNTSPWPSSMAKVSNR